VEFESRLTAPTPVKSEARRAAKLLRELRFENIGFLLYLESTKFSCGKTKVKIPLPEAMATNCMSFTT
jgi:hypothetical protein